MFQHTQQNPDPPGRGHGAGVSRVRHGLEEGGGDPSFDLLLQSVGDVCDEPARSSGTRVQP